MKWKISYYSDDVTEAIKAWPKGIQAKFLRVLDLIEEHGAQLGPPITAHWAMVYLRLGLRPKRG